MDTIGIIIPVHNRKELTLSCLEELQKIDKKNFNTIFFVVDDGSTDGTTQAINELYGDQVVVINGNGNLFWTGAINEGVKIAIESKCDYLLTLNDDISFNKDFLLILYEYIIQNPNSVVGSITKEKNNPAIVINTGIVLNSYNGFLLRGGPKNILTEKPLDLPIKVDCVPGRSMLFPARLVKEIGFFNQKKFPHGFSDNDFSYRALNKGYEIIIHPGSIIYTKTEEKFINYIVESDKLKAIYNLWFDNKFFGFRLAFAFSSLMQAHGIGFLIYQFLRRLKWTFLKALFSSDYLRRNYLKTN